MEHSPSSEAILFSASQEITLILWNLMFHNLFYNSLPSFPILSQINPSMPFPIQLPENSH